jgi:glycosyltransferase involved in cell wall biosynthesis
MAGSRVDLLFDARHIRQSGIGTYIASQLPHVEKTFADRGLSLAVLADGDKLANLRSSTEVVIAEPADAAMYSVREQQAWSNALSRIRPRAIWLPHYPFPLASFRPGNRRTLVFSTVHDTLHLQPGSVTGQGRGHRVYARTMMGLDARRCRTVFVPSEATATGLRAAYPYAPLMVAPIPLDDQWFAPADPELSPIQGRYILFVGNAKWHKNLPLLLKAYGSVASSIPQNLVIAGGGESVRTLDERIDLLAADHADRVRIAGRMEFDALRSLVAGADLLVMPSFHEGVGLPPLEAMASKTAVLASRIPSLQETCGDAAEYFNPHDATELADLLRTYGGDDDARAALAARGFAHVTQRQSQISLSATAEAICTELN